MPTNLQFKHGPRQMKRNVRNTLISFYKIFDKGWIHRNPKLIMLVFVYNHYVRIPYVVCHAQK